MEPSPRAKETTREKFFATVGRLDVHPTSVGEYPYLTEWRHRCGRVAGWSKETSKHKPEKKYYLP